ncbi:CAF17-like 4Fe-4S cluster assembly/insertion protein YgfZ [Brachybacterium aquaticum]|uniref:Folate-binding protein YgfZ n=1 Tax=Brachybacterium aquaticum TaxID=1432564 RepID=A0A841A9Z5_9MICO|nr:glycine cleavage T C-terminal barrel domain-containing protein [Brachybacterium aquaticum]MBB5830431.1 folate-binding protein YgfZ [Brachybacterium aquaticum]
MPDLTPSEPAADAPDTDCAAPARAIRPLLTAGAVLGDGPDAAVPAHYGAPLREQRHLLDGTAVVDLGHLELLEVAGPDARTWMTTITSQVLTGTPVGTSSSLAVLSPQGRVEHLASSVVTGEESLLLVLDPGARAGLRRYLEMMRFAARVELTDRDDLRVLGAPSPAPAVLPGLGLPEPVAVWAEPWPAIAPGGVAYGPPPEDPVGAVLSVFDGAALEALPWEMRHLAGMSSWEALRIADHRARQVREVDERSIPHELDLLRTTVHTAKGCYRGQETVAKVLNLGQPPRRLVMLHLDGSQDVPVVPGGEVRLGGADGKVVGTVTSAALHADLGPIALAVVRRAVPLDAPLTVQVPVAEADGGAGEMWIDAAQEPIVVPRDHGERPATAKL